MRQESRRTGLVLGFLCLTAVPGTLAAQAPPGSIPPQVEQQLRAKARAENPPPAGLRLSEDGESYTYASSPPSQGPGGPSAGGYQATLGRRLSGGIEVSSGQSDLSLKFWPASDALFTSPAVEKDGRLVYQGKGVRYEYAFKRNGVKEDIVYDAAPCRDVNLAFALQRDGGLDFRLDGKGNLLVYGPNAALSGFVQAGDDRSAQLLMKARASAKKDNLLYVVPAPVVLDAEGGRHKDLARYALDGNALTIHTGDLSGLAAPVTIDPSVVVSTTADFLAGNDEGLISFDTNAISRAVPSGGALYWWTGDIGFSTARYMHSSVAYDGYLYVIGGWDGSSYLTSVQVAPIHPDGSMGAWTAATSLPTGLCGHASAVYDGYLYVTGGFGASGSFGEVLSAPVLAGGALGAWTPTTALPSARYLHACAAYDGYLYVIGGWSDACLNEVQFAPIHGDGTVGAWAATTGFTRGRYGLTSAVHNGYLYVLGGMSGPFGYLSDVQYAPIHADGTVGGWTATASFATGRYCLASAVYEGWLYVTGGRNGSGNLGDIQFAPMHTDGSVGPWASTLSISSVRYGHALVAYGGELYMTGGYGASFYGDVQRGLVQPAGGLGNWANAAGLPRKASIHASVACNGYLYLIGGALDYPAYTDDVQYAPINADGTVGPWGPTSKLPHVWAGLEAAVYNGYVYVAGGSNGSGSAQDVQFAKVNGDGTLGAWTAATSLPMGRVGCALVAWHGFLYLSGGILADGNFTYTNQVLYAPILAGGSLGAWATTTPFDTLRQGHASVAYNGFLYVIGGNIPGVDDSNGVQFAPINPADGTLGTWTSTTPFATTGRRDHSAVAYEGRLYVIGGSYEWTPLSSAQFAPINADGSVGAWMPASALPSVSSGPQTVVYDGRMYVVGGVTSTTYNMYVWAAPVYPDATLGAWGAAGAFPTAREDQAAVAYNGYLYVLGGYDLSTDLGDVRFAPILEDGTLGAWAQTTSFGIPRAGLTAEAYKGYLYVIGGCASGGGSCYSLVQYALINADGTVGEWHYTASLIAAGKGHASAVCGGYLYALGGQDEYGYYSDVQYAPIHADGSLGAFAWNATGFDTGRANAAAAAYDGYLYVIGGENAGGSLGDVQVAPVNPTDGSVGAWALTTCLDSGRTQHSSLACNGHLYVIGGNAYGSARSDTLVAPIASDGTLGSWDQAVGFATPRWSHASAAWNGRLYVLGGFDGASVLDDVQVTTLRGPAARGRYSKLLDLGSDQVVDSIAFSSSGHRGATNVTLALAPASAVFDPPMTFPGASPGTIPVGACGRYVWAHFDLDDTQVATVDGGSLIGRGDVLDFAVNYSPLQGIGDALRIVKTTMPDAARLTWTSATGATSYIVQRCDATGGHCTPAPIWTTTDTHFNDYDPLADNKIYWYSIAAANGSCTAP